MTVKVKHSTLADGTFSAQGATAWDADHTLTGVGTMAEQNANNVAITGGAISGVTLPASNITGTLGVPNGGTGATTLTGYVKGAGTTALTASSTIPNTDITGLGTASTKDAGAALGVATLDASGKVPVSELPAAVLGALSYQGTWDASTNTPTLVSSTGTKGYYYVVSVAGNTNLNGITDWLVGDWAVYNGSIWQKVDNTETVTSVNGQTGAVVLTTTNVAEGTNQYFTTARARTSVSAGTGISYDNTTGVITNSSPSLGGDVVGPASATDNAIARFDTTTGKLLQNSVVTVSDTGAIAGVLSITDPNFVDFNTGYTTPVTQGQLGWDGTYNSLSLGMIGGNVIQHIGEDTYIYVKASATITKGQVVMFTGSVGASGVATAAPSTGVTNGQTIIGVAAENITLNGFGLIQTFGELRNIDTSAFADGDILYYNSAVTGGFTTTYPASGPIVTVAAVLNGGSAGGGVITIRVSVTQRITASTGISVSQTSTGTSVTNTGVTSAVAGTGISVSGSTGAVTVTNTAPDQTVVLTGGTGISTSGTYPSFTVTNTAPDQTVALASGTGISVTGTYPSFTVTNTAPSSGGTVTSVSGTGTVNGISLSGTVTSSGNLTLGGTLSNVSLSTQVTGTLPIANGGTGETTRQAAMDALAGAVTSGQYLRGNGTDVVMSAIQAADVPTLNQNTTGTAANVTGTVAIGNGGTGQTTATAAFNALNPMTTTGDIIYEASATTAARLGIGSTGQVLTVAGGLPSWAAAPSGGQYFGSAAVKAIAYNANSIAENVTVTTGNNGLSAGPITISTGFTVTVQTGAVWVIV